MRSLGLALLVVLGACRAEAPPTPEETSALPETKASASVPSAQASDVAITDVAALVGEYRVAGAAGREIDLPHAITARITDAGIHVASDCVNLSWDWFFEDDHLITERVPVEGCGRALLPEEEAIRTAFDGATHVGRTAANGIEFGGENGSVLLFGQ